MTDPLRLQRQFLPVDFKVTTWEALQPFADDLITRTLDSEDDFARWLADWSELTIVLYETGAWITINTTLDTADKNAEKIYADFVEQISAKEITLSNQLEKKMLASPFAATYTQEGFALLRRRAQASLDLYRAENIPLQTEEGIKCLVSGQLKGAMSVEIDGVTMTLQQAAALLESSDRTVREKAWTLSAARYYQDKDALDASMSELIALRHRIAVQAGFANYRDYKFAELQRFDYTSKECFAFHEAIEKHVLPIVKKMQQQRADQMGLEKLRPWDLACDPLGRVPLKPFEGADDLTQKVKNVLHAIDPDIAATITRMEAFKTLDLESRPNKAPGAYNVGLGESGTAFMFSNIAGRVYDVMTFIHEAGHAYHDRLAHSLPLNAYKSYPMELAELASMSLELLAFDALHLVFPDPKECRRVKLDQLQEIVKFFPWCAQIDAIQHAFYTQPDMTAEQRHDAWDAIQKRFATGMVDMTGFEHVRRTAWHKQGHIFEMPFYYIEYGIAQIGALQIWRNAKKDRAKAIAQYKDALALGYTKSIPEVYAAAGISFDFSSQMLSELMAFVEQEMDALVD